MNTYFQRGGSPVVGAVGTQQSRVARSAALLIDFDNVTLGVHTDLGRELKSLINSEVFRGKIAVRRAYADWRRYPNYVVPLTEASIDLIFAPAYGSSKKNTTDLRMSADAIELAFTRPEIDTFILLTGDSDFSSTVMKLKEYGKYVIGVGMRESSSDLIIQNCDEYFSYHALTGLTRTTAGEGMKEDPWELAIRAAQKMVASGDAMRTDRLKQVMLSIDPGFNEKELGYSKFSRFVAELEKKGLVRLHKLPDGQYEISVDGRTTPAVPVPPVEEAPVARESRGGPREGRRDRRGRRREPSEAEVRGAPVTAAEPPATVEAVPEPAAVPQVAEPAREAVRPLEPAAAAAAPVVGEATPQDRPMQDGLALLQQAVRDLAPKRGVSVRDGDVKRRMVELESGFDEAKLGFSKFSRFLRAAHDAEAIDLQRLDSGSYEVTLGSRPFTRPAAAAAGTRAEAAPVETARVEAAPVETVPVEAVPAVSQAPPAAPPPSSPPAAEPARALRGRRRGRGGPTPEAGAPPILPGQVVPSPREGLEPAAAVVTETATPDVEAPAAVAEEAAAAPAPERKRRTRGRGRKKAAEVAPEVTEAAAEPAPEEVAPAPPAFSAEALGLPTEPAAIAAYVAREYRGVGKKTVEPLLEAFGPDIFRVFAEEPQRVHEVLRDRRADVVLSRWADDLARRTAADAAVEPAPAEDLHVPEPQPEAVSEPEAQAPTPQEAPTEPAPKKRRRGGRARRTKAEPAEAPPPVAVAEVPEPASTPAPTKTPPRRKRSAPRAKKAAAPAPDADAVQPSPPAAGAELQIPAAEENGKTTKRSRPRGGGKGRTGRRKPEPTKA